MRKAYLLTSSVLSLPESNLRMVETLIGKTITLDLESSDAIEEMEKV
jgi:hypothetical protein